MKTVCLFLIAFLISTFGTAQDITGQWNGLLKVQGMRLPLVFNISQDGEGYTATMDSPDQGAFGIPVTFVTYKGSTLNIEISSAGIAYEGTLDNENNFEGNFKQAGLVLPLKLMRGEIKKEEVKRPQEPQKPYPYVVEEVKFENSKDNFFLSGTLTLPKEEGSFPAVVLISGSGPQDRDETIADHKPFLVLADYLTKNGIAVLRYDDRGFGESGGKFSQATTKDFATDTEFALEYLKTRKEINKDKIGLIGHSEGGIIAAMLASENSDIDFIVLLAGSAMQGDQLLLLQKRKIQSQMGLNKKMIDQDQKIMSGVYDLIIAGQVSGQALKDSLNSNFISGYGPLLPDAQRNAAVNQLTSPWMQSFIRTDPAAYLAKVTCPVLALNGEKDMQVPAAENLKIISSELTKADNKNFEIIAFEGLNHLFQECKTGLPSEYGEIEQTMATEVLEAISNWILEIVNK